MRTRSFIVSLLFFGVIGLATHVFSQEQPGRYQLFQGEYESTSTTADKFERTWIKALFRIDTATGEVWVGSEEIRIGEGGVLHSYRGWRHFEREAPKRSRQKP